MPYCPSAFTFSEAHAHKRVQAASKTLGEGVAHRILALALFLMGARRQAIAQYLGMPLGTLLSLLTRIGRDGLPALEDRRQRHAECLPVASPAPAVQVATRASAVVVDFGRPGPSVAIPADNRLQTRVFLLTLLDNGLLERDQVAEMLGYSPAHTAHLARQLAQGDVPALLDRRQGQKQDYRVPPQVKAELIQQFAVDVIARGKTSGQAIANELQARCKITLSPRTVRHHLAQLGLPSIRRSLPELVAAVEKTSSASS